MPTLGHITPFCIVSDLRHAADFYRDAIGFRIVCLVPEDDPFLTIVECDSMRIMLKAIAPDVAPQPNYTRHEWARWDAYVFVDDPHALAAEYGARDVRFREALADTEDGLRGVAVYDRHGYVIFFGRPLSPASSLQRAGPFVAALVNSLSRDRCTPLASKFSGASQHS